MKLKVALVWINSVIFIVYGLGFIFFPEILGLLVTDALPATTSATIDIRATYGGMTLGVGILFGLSARKSETVQLGLWGVVLIMTGMAGSRLFGIVIDGSPNSVMYLYLVAEVLMALLALGAIRQHESSKS